MSLDLKGKYIKPRPFNGRDLEGVWFASLKIDGVNASFKGGQWVSRLGNPLKGLRDVPGLEGEVVEVYAGDWESSVSLAKKRLDSTDSLYRLHPEVDTRLHFGVLHSPTAEELDSLLEEATDGGYEGLVLSNDAGKSYKIKPVETYDVKVTGIQMGTGKYEGMLGALLTPMGKVGTGFTDAQRTELLELPIGTTIEVDCMSLTPAGKFRHPRFVRERWDK